MKKISDNFLKEIIFGLEDGMVSTLGALTGVAIGSHDSQIVLLTGAVVVAVESISMGIGSYLSGQSIRERQLNELNIEKMLVHKKTAVEIEELKTMLLEDGWSKQLTKKMIEESGKNKELLFREMQYRELGLHLRKMERTDHSAWGMFFAYVIGGFVPLSAYLFFAINQAMWISVVFSLSGLFILGFLIAEQSGWTRWKRGLRMMLFGGLATLVGWLAGWWFKI